MAPITPNWGPRAHLPGNALGRRLTPAEWQALRALRADLARARLRDGGARELQALREWRAGLPR